MSQLPLFRRRRLGSNSEKENLLGSENLKQNFGLEQQQLKNRFNFSLQQTASLVKDPSLASKQKN
jgi:hypothetical protein